MSDIPTPLDCWCTVSPTPLDCRCIVSPCPCIRARFDSCILVGVWWDDACPNATRLRRAATPASDGIMNTFACDLHAPAVAEIAHLPSGGEFTNVLRELRICGLGGGCTSKEFLLLPDARVSADLHRRGFLCSVAADDMHVVAVPEAPDLHSDA